MNELRTGGLWDGGYEVMHGGEACPHLAICLDCGSDVHCVACAEHNREWFHVDAVYGHDAVHVVEIVEICDEDFGFDDMWLIVRTYYYDEHGELEDVDEQEMTFEQLCDWMRV